VIRERKKALGIDDAGSKVTGSVLERASKQRKYLDFLDILLTAQDEDGKGLSDLEVRDEADTFMFEGHDTTTSGMSWTLYCLAQHPEHQDKIREEVRNVLMGREWLEYDDLKKLNYTTWCIKEAMRLYPPVFEVIRVTTEDTELDDHVIPKNTIVVISIIQIHRHPDTWENPDEYNPLRFHPSNAEGRHPYAYIPFSAGYRNCIGQNFALNEEKMVIASIIHRFRVTLDDAHEVEIVPRVILRTRNDIKIKLSLV
jgi:cytochrome P450